MRDRPYNERKIRKADTHFGYAADWPLGHGDIALSAASDESAVISRRPLIGAAVTFSSITHGMRNRTLDHEKEIVFAKKCLLNRHPRGPLRYVRYDFPPQLTTDSSQSARVPIAKNSEIFWLECDDEVFVVAPDGHSSPRCTLERFVDLVRNY
jgi:hypothetical protein